MLGVHLQSSHKRSAYYTPVEDFFRDELTVQAVVLQPQELQPHPASRQLSRNTAVTNRWQTRLADMTSSGAETSF